LLYGPLAPVYDVFTRWLFLGEWARWQQTALGFLPERGVIGELGAGTGALAAAGTRPGRVWLAIEPSAAMLAVARRRTSPGLTFLRARAQALPIATGAVDAVVATFPTRDILDLLTAAEIARILKPGGALVVVLSGSLAADSPRRRLRRIGLSLFDGRWDDRLQNTIAIPGFSAALHQITTTHGLAIVYVGQVIGVSGQP
jgi:ubiquinone/menaquinone biosynthesis C-methylase UbiE